MTNQTSPYDNYLFAIKRSTRYHMHRCRFYDGFNDITTALTVMLGMSAIYTALDGNITKTAMALIGAFISTLGVANLVMRTSRKARLHNDLARRFIDIEKKLLTCGEEYLSQLNIDRLEVEKDEPPVLNILNIICHNELMTAMGYEKSELVKVGWFQRLLSSFFDFRS